MLLPMDGLLQIDKPKGWTSFDVVAKVRGLLKSAGIQKPKVGHTGTLDPLATGLLVLTLGSYCKKAGEYSKLDKIYDVTLRLGETSTTDDNEGEKTKTSTHAPTQKEVQLAVEHFIGEIEQIPPAFSAIKVGGKRAYKLARAGQPVKLEARQLTIHAIDSIRYIYPEVTFTAHVSSGTYIRSLVRDIGERLGTGAYMSDLRRSSIGKFEIDEAVSPDQLSITEITRRLRLE